MVDVFVLLVLFKWSKTVQFGERVIKILMLEIPGILCPVAAFQNMIKHTPYLKNNALEPMKYTQFQSFLWLMISKCNKDTHLYSTHSYWRDGASFVFKAKVPGELIKSHSDWYLFGIPGIPSRTKIKSFSNDEKKYFEVCLIICMYKDCCDLRPHCKICQAESSADIDDIITFIVLNYKVIIVHVPVGTNNVNRLSNFFSICAIFYLNDIFSSLCI